MIKRINFFVILLALVCYSNLASAQSTYFVRASLPDFSKSEIVLKGFTFQGDTLLSTIQADDKGGFLLLYPSNYVGLATIFYGKNKKKSVVLNHENIDFTINGQYNGFSFVESTEDKLVKKGNDLLNSCDFKLIDFSSLCANYPNDPESQLFLLNEIKEEEDRVDAFISSLPSTSYAKFYINFRKSMVSMNVTANKIPSRLAAHEKVFNHLDFSEARLQTSSYYKNFISIYFRMLSTYADTDRSIHINKSIDAIVLGLKKNPKLLENMSVYLLDVLEKNQYNSSVNYLANAMLSQPNGLVTSENKKRFEACLVKITN